MKIAKYLFAAALTATVFSLCTGAAGFTKSQTYAEGMFTDVPVTEWYASEVKSTYELGLMNGVGENLFAPEGNVTVAEAITMASRANALYLGQSIAPADGEWYQMYVNYAQSMGFISGGQFDDYDRPAKRYEVAKIFEDAMPEGYFTVKNTVTEIPDVSEAQPYQSDLLTLYRAGVVMGSDSYGNFRPENNITRAEAAAIINRVALPENRLVKTLDVYSPDYAYLLVYNNSFDAWGGKEGINSGWELDNRGGAPRTDIYEAYGSLADVSTEYGTAMIREFNNTTTGCIKMETRYTISENSDGVYIEFRNADGKSVYRLEVKDGAWRYLEADGSYTAVYPFEKSETVFGFCVYIDLDNNRSTTYINNKDCGTYALATSGQATNLQNYRYGTTEASTSVITSTFMSMAVNYAVYDTFVLDNQDVPLGWSGENTTAKGSLSIAKDGWAAKTFTPVSGTVVAESKFLFDEGQNAEYTFLSGNKPVMVFSSDDTNLYANGVKVYDNYVRTVRYTFRLEMNTDTQTALIKVNGRKVGEVPFANAATSVDNLVIANRGEGAVGVPYMRVFEKKLPEDYVPVPVIPAGQEKYNVGINVCSLWRNGMHSGWSCISPYDDIRPVLGYYDEGNPETADWEIKYMVEHGIDFQAFCWFAGENTVPINQTPNDYQLRDGYMNAEYADMMKYCIIWEASSGAAPQNMQQWKEYFVPYFIEHFFKDSRYMVIDNRPLLFVFTPDKLYTSKGFGSTAVCKQAFDYLEQEVRKLGFDGMIYVGSNGASSKEVASAGYDATSAYNWGSSGYQFETNKTRNETNARDTSVFTIPTLSVGFNSVAWHGTRYPLMSAENLKKTALWARDEFSPSIAEAGTWQENLYMISTWNEYGEGTYVMPCEDLNGFGYLDALREVFTDEKADAALNTVPTAAQKQRINRLYPQHKILLHKNGDYTEPETELNLDDYHTVLSINPGTHPGGINPVGIDNWVKNENGISGVTNVTNNYIAFGNGNSLDLSTATLVKITAKIPKGCSMRFYFTTNDDQSWNESKATSAASATTDELAEYYFDFSKNAGWKGTLLWYRIDPSTSVGDAFEITSIEFLGSPDMAPEEKTSLFVNGNKVEMKLPPAKAANGDYLIAFDPSIGLEFLFNSFYTWDDAKKTLTVETCGHTVVYTVGSDKYLADGKQKSLGYTMYTFDELPMIPLKKFCEDVGYTFTMTEDGPSVETTETVVKADFYEAKNNRVAYSWEFNVNGDNESWASSHMSLLTADGFMACTSISASTDPILTNAAFQPFEAAKYTKLQFRVRYEYTPTMAEVLDEDGNPTGEQKERTEALTLYFATTSDPNLSEGKTIKLMLNGNSSNGEWEEYECTIENEAWKDKITKIRFDPFNAVGKIDIDYFRIVEDPEYEIRKNMPKPFEIVNPDAEGDKVGFISHNANVSIIMDPVDGDDHCYLFTPKNDTKQWIYAIQDVSFTPGKTYQIDYDICFVGVGSKAEANLDVSVSALCNFQYNDPNGSSNHIVSGSSATLSYERGWVHVSAKHTVSEGSVERNADRFTIYANPVGDVGVAFCLDNVVVKEVD